ncbi:polysaccharide biosynthesis tyrosine autokinase [Salipiger marinus]|uniref:polysaccharide biosynthesis tyrosine autokinase n=1 Tax=Salipiger marinus TaxID=555512 RepID=UPI002C8C5C0B|nr:polysaccharide biosynthesis tyrosine autokinase [Salipiger manganoxidans]MEB3421128.1 polysaccharide biosynthesis tyrosine autokinase [Salipiger manganoxidans]
MNNAGAVSQTEQEDDTIDLLGLVKSLWRGKWLIFLCIFAGFLAGGYYAYSVAVPKYAATTTLALQVRNQQVVDLESVFSGVSTESAAMNTELVVIQSRGLLRKVVDELSLNTDPEFNSALRPVSEFSLQGIKAKISERVLGRQPQEDGGPQSEAAINRAIVALGLAVSAEIEPDTYVFQIRAETQSPEKSSLIVNTLAQIYIEDQVNVKFQATESAVTWLSERVVELEAELAEKEDQIKQMRSEMDLVTQEGVQFLNQRVRDLRDRLERSRSDLEALESRIVTLREVRESEDPELIAEAFADAALNRLRNQTPGELSNGQLQAFLALADQRIAELENDLVRTRLQFQSLETSLASAEAEANEEFDKFVQVQQAEREASAVRTLYETFVTRLKETSVQRGSQQADSRVLSESPEGFYVSPQKPRVMALTAILGMMVGMAIVLGRQHFHSGLRTSEELERISDLPVLGQVPKLKIRNRSELIPFLKNNPTSAAVEAFRNLRTSVLLSSLDHPPQIIAVTSSVPGEGKTTNSLALAQNFAGLGKRVLLLEGDIRRQTLHAYVEGSHKSGGWLAALEGERPLEEVLHRDSGMGIDVLFGEKTPVNATDVFSSTKFQEFLQALRDRYDHIIIDTPPVLVVPDARVLGQYCDALLFTVAWDRTNAQQIRESIRQMSSVNLKITGMVLSQIDAAGMKRYGYGDNYGAYSGYGKSYYDS